MRAGGNVSLAGKYRNSGRRSDPHAAFASEKIVERVTCMSLAWKVCASLSSARPMEDGGGGGHTVIPKGSLMCRLTVYKLDTIHSVMEQLNTKDRQMATQSAAVGETGAPASQCRPVGGGNGSGLSPHVQAVSRQK